MVLEAQKRWQRHLASHPQDSNRTDLLEQVRARVATLINADADEIALTRSTTEGINLLTQGMDWQEGDEIILDRYDHFTAFQSFLNLTRRHGVKLVFVDLSAEPGSDADIIAKYAAAITPRTRILFLNWVNYRAGFRMPVKALAELGHRHGLIVSVDAAQAFGALPIDIADTGIDHLAAPSHKWILGGSGAGFAYFSKRILDRVWPIAGPAHVPGTPVAWQDTARKLDNHRPKNLASEMGFLEAIEFYETIGETVFHERLDTLSRLLRDSLDQVGWGRVLTPRAPGRAAAITSFHVGEDRSADDIARRLWEQFQIKVNSSAFAKLNALRISPHIYNSEAQIRFLVEALVTFRNRDKGESS
ncbi:aminotransferase class V-fold PLP-dependent enzyme [Niveispirillum sp. BGYR6]|uniref:aminotransferase class V-fold PLP-dependent enzyme n=1 Tax=Niveispirillum sp. BGYR6 TaxID=2971249 RepID=UPI0022B97887|nr:aminotransferase class V-fold PLP-dependent enzyme [Niveispirillum sp. BGYR6]MDG5497515.1 aminotransferase class V-fold PLP-dependent enzyme [Niveispirillum sp. BGYR6]